MARRTRIKISVPIIVKEKKSEEETPIISPLQVTDFSSSSITTEFSVSTTKAEEVVKGVLCGKINPPTFDNADYRLLYGKGDVNLTFAGLNNNTEYYLRPYALSNLGYKYGDVTVQKTRHSPIPDEYQLVEYLENIDKSFIIIPIFGRSGQTYEAVVQHTSTSNDACLIGGNQGANRFYPIYMYPGNQFCLGYNSNFSVQGFSRNEKMKITAIMNDGEQKLYKNDVLFAHSDRIGNIITDTQLMVFKYANTNNFYMSAKLFYLKINDNSGLLIYLYPVYRKSDNKPGMYDIVNEVFYTNQGTREFLVGPDKEWEE